MRMGFMKTKKVPQKIKKVTSFLGVFFPTPPLLIPHFYDVIEGLSSSSLTKVHICIVDRYDNKFRTVRITLSISNLA